ncbi:MAG: glutathione S-transferase N-terminal domain-containing protein, partial [Candidatus Binatia bacterium]
MPHLHFVGLAGSPWTERARWMFDHHGLAYRYTAYRPLLDQPWLRWFARQPTGRLHLPVLRDRQQVVIGSFQVVQHAERAGTRARLLLDISAIVAWNRLADQVNAAGRLLGGQRLLADAAGLDET